MLLLRSLPSTALLQVSVLYLLSAVVAFSLEIHGTVMASAIPSMLVDICRQV